VTYYIGVMSGTSLDGIDVAIIEQQTAIPSKLIAAQTYPFEVNLRLGLQQLIETQQCELKRFGELDIALGKAIATAINKLLATTTLTATDIAAIGSHGQTVFHQPDSEDAFSLQIGNPNVIAELTNITTIADFRQRDMVLGGQGAPLVPAFHQGLFQTAEQNRVIVNIGGISNITTLPSSTEKTVLGFDTGPGNALLDAWFSHHHDGQAYDYDGLWASSGNVNQQLLNMLLEDSYFKQTIPKSTGREYFHLNWLDHILEKCTHLALLPQDIQASLVSLTVQTIAADIRRYADNSTAIYVCGGGAHNSYLMQQLQQALPNKAVLTTSELGLAPDWVEACAFAWLASQTLANKTGNLPAVTGASKTTVLGGIYSSNDAS